MSNQAAHPESNTLLGRASAQMQSKPCCSEPASEGDKHKQQKNAADLQLYTDNPPRPSRAADRSALSCLHDVLELEEGVVRCLRIIGIHSGVQVVWHGGVSDPM